MQAKQWARAALQTFDDVVAAMPGLRPRAGQRDMAALVADTLAQAPLGKLEDSSVRPTAAIAVIQAGTGVGKSLAYCTPAIAQAVARGTRVVISTATVALQEQLVNKDLPALAAQMPQAFRYALAKGRGRFVCKLKLDRLAGVGDSPQEATPDLFMDAPEEAASQPPQAVQQARMQVYAAMAEALASSQWDGDRDSLDTPPEPEVWQPVAAEGHSCTGRHCPAFHSCSYYERRKTLVAAQVLVVNHDLLLTSLGARLLPELDSCLLVLDEAHHLPATALAQFACQMDVSRLQWLERLTSQALRIGQLLEVSDIADLPQHSSGLRQSLTQLAQQAQTLLQAPPATASAPRPATTASTQQWRFPDGQLPPDMLALLEATLQHAQGYMDVLRAIALALKNAIKEQPDEAPRLSMLYAQLGSLAPRLEAVYATTELLLQQPNPGQPPAAKWLTQSSDGAYLVTQFHASPILPGASLRHRLWSQVRGAVLTSATLSSCGSFDFFLREAGLHDLPQVRTLEVASPFDYARQGRLTIHHTQADPRQAHSFTPEMVHALLHDLAQVQAGALVLFTSRDQLRQAVDALPSHLRQRVLVQTAMPRASLLAQHRQQVEQGQASIIFGMQSFGEGLDLPGDLCAALFITKLPFAPPDDPVGQARSEWLQASGRNAFVELVVPATAIRLAQWVGRAIRTEEDQAQVFCYDRRLVQTSYGQQMLKTLPAFVRQERGAL